LILDIPARLGLERAKKRGAATADGPDRFEKEELETHEKRREAYLDIAAREPERCHVIDSTQSEEAIAAEIFAIIDQRLVPVFTDKMPEAANE
jgi:dTMP kinase